MRTLLSIALVTAALVGCAGPAEKRAAAGAGEPAEMEDLEADGPFDATLEDEPGE
jgi:hypothetical protein